jgi:tetratricopeptide (TPR) repeat protein
MVTAILLATGTGLSANDAVGVPTWSQHLAAAQEQERAGNLVRAQLELDRALGDARATGDSVAVAQVLDQMGAFDDHIGHFVEAESRFEDSLAIWRKRLGRDHIALVRVINHMAALYLETGQLGKAERLDLSQWQERVEASNPVSDDLLPLLQNVATLDSMRGRFTEALKRFQEALNLMQRRGRCGSAEHAVTLNNLGLACLRAKHFDSAIQHLSISVALWEKLRGADTVNVGLTGYNLALAYEAAGRVTEAEPEMRRALAISEECLGPASLRTGEVLRSYAQVLRKLHRKAEAKEIGARADRILRGQAHEEPARHVVDVTDLSFRPR